MKIAILISGSGTNLQAIIDRAKQAYCPYEIVSVICNKKDAYGLTRAKEAGIPTTIIEHKDFSDRATFDQALDAAIIKSGAELVVLAGFMRLLTDDFVNKWQGKMVNIHPSLLPSFKGVGAQKQALEAGNKVTGCTTHFVVPEMDSGPIIMQMAVPILPDDTEETLVTRLLKAEHQCYPETLCLLAKGEYRIEGNHVITDSSLPYHL